MGTIPCGPCERCAEGPTRDQPHNIGPFDPIYVDSIPDARVPGTHPSECGYRWQLLCMIHAAERRQVATSRVQPVLWCESEGVFRIEGGRAGGGCVCAECRREYFRHPRSKDFDFLTVLCDGTLVKL